MAGQHVTYQTAETHGQSVKFCPLNENRLACVTGTEFGLEGEGFVFVLERNEASGELELLHKMEYRDNLFDVCWSEAEQNLLVTAAGDGFIQVWNLGSKHPRVPVHEFKGHRKEMSAVSWCLPKYANTVLASCWDGTVSCYDMALSSPWPSRKMTVSDLLVYECHWSPHHAGHYISVSSDGVLQLWDLNVNTTKAQIYLSASDSELLTCDWGKYSEFVVATGGSDAVIRGWDLRKYSLPVFQIEDHGHAVKRVRFSPFHPSIIASGSYDLSVRLFDFSLPVPGLEILSHHSEFVYGLDWNVKKKNELVSCAFDQSVQIFTPDSLKGK